MRTKIHMACVPPLGLVLSCGNTKLTQKRLHNKYRHPTVLYDITLRYGVMHRMKSTMQSLIFKKSNKIPQIFYAYTTKRQLQGTFLAHLGSDLKKSQNLTLAADINCKYEGPKKTASRQL